MPKKSLKSDGWKITQQAIEKRKLNIFDRFIDRIRSTFQKFQGDSEKQEKEKQLHGRIQDLHANADAILSQLQTIKEELKKDSSPEVFSHVEEVVDPIIREVSRLYNSLEQPNSVTQQAKTFQRYSQWIEKAKLWVQIYSKADNKEAIIKGITHYIVEDFLEVIDRDVQVINDYQEHMLDALALDDDEKVELALHIEARLDPYLRGLNDLRTKPKDLSLHEIAVWKAQVDKRREKYFDATLHAIDKIINQTLPDSTGEEDHEHLLDVLSQIVYLEHEVPDFYDDLYIAKDAPASQKEVLLEIGSSRTRSASAVSGSPVNP
jgi:hypothetical protein